MTATSTRTRPLERAIRTEARLAVATPVARLLLVGSVVMAAMSCSANLAVLDNLVGEEPVRVALHSATVPGLVFALLAGGYGASTDRRFGFVDQRLLTDPSRARWLAAKAAVQALVGVGYGILAAATAIATSSAVFAMRGESFDVGSMAVSRALLGVAVAAPLFAVLGTAAGSLTSNTPAVVAGLLVWMLVVEPPAVLGLPAIGRRFPGAAGLALTYSPDPDLLGQLAGGLTLLVYSTVAIALVAHRLERIDL